MGRVSWSSVVCLVAAASGCAFESYESDPLEPGPVVAELLDDRAALVESHGGPMSLARAIELLRIRGPEVRAAIAAYRAAWERSEVETPWPNPMVTVGTEIGFGSPVTSNEVVPVTALGFTIPLGDRLEGEDRVRRARAESARLDALARFRELHLEVRERYAAAVGARARLALARRLDVATAEASALSDRLVAAGAFGATDVGRLQLDRQRARVAVLTAEHEVAERAGALARLLAVDTAAVPEPPEGDSIPADPVPGDIASLAKLRELLVAWHPDLQRLRGQHAVAEQVLWREIQEQYPDLVLGAQPRGDPGDSRTLLGLSLGIRVPIFDRNQQGIADAKSRRQQLREQYVARAEQALSELATAHRVLAIATARLAAAGGPALTLARDQQAETRRAATAGLVGAAAVLAADRAALQVEREALDAYLDYRSACFGLERAVGQPLFVMPGEDGTITPPKELLADREDES